MIEITKPKQLEKFICDSLNSDILCLDTEFIRENTYRPEMCLIQAQTRDETYLIDPFCFDNLEIMSKVLLDEDVVKVFHACGQDIEILYNTVGVLPKNIFDVQIASTIINGLNQPSLGNLLAASIDVHIDKSESFTDWSKRPLTPAQLKYAVEDVLYLPELYDYQISQLKKLGRERWLDDDFAALLDEKKYEVDAYEQYKHLKHINRLGGFELKLARDVCAWRERRAETLNCPRRHVMSDEQVIEIAKRNPHSLDDLLNIRGIDSVLNISEMREILSILSFARKKPNIELLFDPKQTDSGKNIDALIDGMNAIIKVRAHEYGISPAVFTKNSDLSLVARGFSDKAEVCKGWRGELVGRDLLDFLAGKIELRVENGKLRIERR